MTLIEQIRDKARKAGKRIVLPESKDGRMLMAANYLAEHKICKPILIGNAVDITRAAEEQNLILRDDITIIEPKVWKKNELYAQHLYERRRNKGLTIDAARELVLNELFFAAEMLVHNDADGCVAGAVNTTGDVLRAGIQVIGLKAGSTVVSSTFLMTMPDGNVFTYGDCAVVPYPDSNQLASIAIDSSRTHQKLTGEKARTAMLSFSTKGSAVHEKTQLVTAATAIARETASDLEIDGELQFDAALLPAIGQKKAPESSVAGNANVFIFPNLDAGNIGYKITERLAGAVATGPIIQGLAKPMNDLSRGCSWQDIVNTAAVSALQAE
ncbi:MAG: phosphate acetyltransferase [Bacteroidetes bacterium]|nr:phosphate acetyltransferase [Bacteroidota bacterium]